MATIREYFDTDARALTIHKSWTCSPRNAATSVEIIAKIAYDFEANAKYWYIYIPENSGLSGCLGAIFATPELAECQLGREGDGALVEMGHSDFPSGYRVRPCNLPGEFTFTWTLTYRCRIGIRL